MCWQCRSFELGLQLCKFNLNVSFACFRWNALARFTVYFDRMPESRQQFFACRHKSQVDGSEMRIAK